MLQHRWVFVVLASSVGLAALTMEARAGERKVVGLIEDVQLASTDFTIRAKIDTGATGTSVDARDVREFYRDGKRWVRFVVPNGNDHAVTFERPILRTVSIRRAGTIPEKRLVVGLDVCVGTVVKTIGVNLTRRDGMEYGMLIGRDFLNGSYLVDPAVNHLTRPECPSSRAG